MIEIEYHDVGGVANGERAHGLGKRRRAAG
jgi:hypothetical protein